MICPICGKENTDNRPLNIDGEVKFGGCQECWEKQVDEDWHGQVMAISQIMLQEDTV